MKIIETKHLTIQQKNVIFELWNQEYPTQLAFTEIDALDIYLQNLENQQHFFALNENEQIVAWAFTFERDSERWFAIIIDSKQQRKGLGSLLLNVLKEKEQILTGWVTDHNNYTKQNGEIYPSPLPFYLKNGFAVCENVRLKTEKLSAAKIRYVRN